MTRSPTKLGFENLEELRDDPCQQMQREYDQLVADAPEAPVARRARGAVRSLPSPKAWSRPNSTRSGSGSRPTARPASWTTDDAGKDDETLKAEYRAIAERRVRLGLLLAEIGRVNAIAVAPDEMNRAMRAEAARYSGQEQQVMEFFRKNPQAAETLRGPIFEDKVVDFVLELATRHGPDGDAGGTDGRRTTGGSAEARPSCRARTTGAAA